MLALLAFAAGVSYALTISNCADGTQYGICSTAHPGMWCHGSIEAPTLDLFIDQCPCTAVAGYVQVGTGDTASCELAKCGSLNNGDCNTSNKPKMCSYGSFIDNSTKCGCPSGMVKNNDGLGCSYPPCNDTGITVANGVCSSKTIGKKCTNGVLVDKASECPCTGGLTKIGETCVKVCSDGTVEGNCSASQPYACTNAYLMENATKCGCPAGQVAVGTRCGNESAIDGLLGITNLSTLQLGNQTLVPAGQAGASGNLCCCLPTAMMAIAGGFVFSRRRK